MFLTYNGCCEYNILGSRRYCLPSSITDDSSEAISSLPGFLDFFATIYYISSKSEIIDPWPLANLQDEKGLLFATGYYNRILMGEEKTAARITS